MRACGCIVLICLFVVAIPLLLTWFMLEDYPAVADLPAPTPEDAARAKSLVKKLWTDLNQSAEPIRIEVSEAELNGMAALAGSAVSRVQGRVEIVPSGVASIFTFKLRDRVDGPYVNAYLRILPSESELELEELSLGRVPVPPSVALSLLRWSLNWVMGDDSGDLLLAAVERLEIEEDRVLVELRPLPDVRARLVRAREHIRDVQGELALLAAPEDVRIFYEHIISLVENVPTGARQSFAEYVSPLFTLAASRSSTGDPILRNREAILALAMYFGDRRVEQVIGAVRTAEHRDHRSRSDGITLGGRVDLRRHFILSAAIEVMSDVGMSQSVGELKELLDVNKGGSGFSFVDLAADRAGTRFAEVATGAEGATFQQQLADDPGEDFFFPDTDGLPEGLKESAFEERFGSVDSPEYLELVAEIDRRIDALPAYR